MKGFGACLERALTSNSLEHDRGFFSTRSSDHLVSNIRFPYRGIDVHRWCKVPWLHRLGSGVHWRVCVELGGQLTVSRATQVRRYKKSFFDFADFIESRRQRS